MYKRSPILFVQDISDAVDAISNYVEDISFEAFCDDRMRYSAVIREFEIIGEAVGKLPEDLIDLFPDIHWQDIKDFRNLLIHEYFGVDLEIVWSVIRDDLPMLKKAIKKMKTSL